MSDEQISLLERYLLEDDKEKFFSTLVKNSETYINMKLVDHVNRYGLSDLPKDSQTELQAYLSEPKHKKTLIQFKVKLLEISQEKNAAKKKSLINKFNTEFLSVCFNHSRPANIKQSENLKSQFETTLPSTFSDEKFELSKSIESFFNQPDWNKIKEFKPTFFYKFDMNRLLDKKVECFEHVLNSLTSFTHVTELHKLLKKYVAEKRKINKAFVLNQAYFNKMSLEQLEQVREHITYIKDDRNFFATLFQKTFETELGTLQHQEDLSSDEYRSLLLKMYNWSEQLPETDTYMSFRSQFLRAVVEFDLECNKLNKDMFIAYLENPNNTLGVMEKSYTKELTNRGKYDNFWHATHNLKVGEWTGEEKLVEAYLNHFFKEMSNFGEFEKYFTPCFLKKQFYTAKIQNGENIENITKIFSESELSELREAKKLKFVSWNKSTFALGEEITLHLEVKNIQNFCVNIFEINTESYYRKNKTEINERINLTGLIPSKSTEHNLDTPPIISQIMEFKDLFPSKRGVFIVEFIGSGLSSRALIRIGALSLIRQVLSKGLLFHMIDEQKNICHSETTDIIVADKLFKPEPKLSHGILIPYSNTEINETAILRHEGYAEIYNLQVPSERLTFDMGLVFNEETLIAGAQVDFLLMPKMYVNGKAVANSTIKKLKAEIRSTNDIGIDNTTNVDDIKLDGNKDAVVNYLIPPKTESISITITGKFASSAQEKEVDVTNTKTISINRYRDRYIYYGTYLSQNDSKYTLHFLGKNGEPYPQQKVQISFTPKYLNKNETVQFETDLKGEIQLGELTNVSHISINMIDSPCTEKYNTSYSIENNDKITTLPRMFDIVEGEDICFPLAADAYDAADYELVRVCKDNLANTILDCTANIACEDGVVYLTKLTPGTYKFLYRSLSVIITIKVHKGTRWEASADYLIKERSILKLLTQSLYLAYKDLKVDAGKVSFTVLSNNMSSVQVHAFAYSYVPTTFATMSQAIKSIKVSETSESFKFSTNTNAYLSEKSLGDEIKYVLERKRKNTFMGNTLEKPSSLLKRHFMRETNQDQEQLNVERDYGAAMKKRAGHKDNLAGIAQRAVSTHNYSINNLNSFLGREGWTQFNIQPDENGVVSFDLPDAACYGSLLFVIKDNKNSIIETRSLHCEQKQFKQIALLQSKTANKVYLYDRIAHAIGKDQTCEIKDLAATELSMVEDVKTLFKMVKLISNNSAIDEWDFVSKWTSLSPEDQIKKYDKYISHEFNLFAYFKDKEFFGAVVKPHIANKSSKQFIDHFLLENTDEVRAYLSPARLQTLNVLEVSLLIKYFAASEPERCGAIAANIRQIVSSQYVDIKEFKRLFDSVLKAQDATEGMAGAVPARGPQMMNRAQPMMQQTMMMNNFSNRGPRMMMQQAMPSSNYNRMDRAYGERISTNIVQMSPQQYYASPLQQMNMDFNINQEFNSEAIELAMDDAYYDAESAYGGGYGAPLSSLPKVEKYRTLGVTKEYIERHYYSGENADHMEYNKFWSDYVQYCLTGDTTPFLTSNFIYASSTLTEMLAVLALVDLPFDKVQHQSESGSNQLKLTAGSNCIIFSKEIQEKGDKKLDLDILISQRFYDPFDRYVHSSDGHTKMLKNVNEFLVGKLYVSRVAITNSSETRHEINLVTEIPQGSVPVISLEYMKSTSLAIEPLSTEVIEFFFYFPTAGDFTCYPASINKDGSLVTTASGVSNLKVVKSRQIPELKTLTDILSMGNKTDILDFMDKENLHNADVFTFSNIYWLLDDEKFYQEVLGLLKHKFIYDETVWSFSIKHGDYDTFVEYLNYSKFRDSNISVTDGEVLYLDTPVLSVDKFTFKEYNPLINPRVHDIGEFKHNILNRDFKQTYLSFLRYLFQKTFLTARDYTYFCTYLLLQDRIDDCLALYKRIDQAAVCKDLKIQYEYLTAYLDLYSDYPKFTKAREICAEYLTYPVFGWRNRFIDLLNQISEFDGETELLEKQTDETDTDKNQRQAKKEEYVASELQGKTIKITSKNIQSVSIKFYKVDLEIMFSQDPFLSVDKNDYSYVTPNHTEEKKLQMTTDFSTDSVPIPEHLVSSNLIIQVSSGALSENLTYFPASMKVYIVKNFGQIKVTSEETDKPLSNVYIKCFSKKTSGAVTFYKDGYTDLRGTFEYTSVHSSDFQDVQDFSILVFSDKHGALIKQTKPPVAVAKVEVTAHNIISTKLQMAQNQMRSKAANKYMMM